MSVQEFVFDHVVRQGQRALLVVDGGRLLGIVSITDAKELPRGFVAASLSMPPSTSAMQEAPPPVGVIDADPAGRAGIRALLQPLGVDVVAFDSAEAYLTSGAARELSCLIVDLLLPGMSGLELLRHLRSQGNDVPLILLADESLGGLDESEMSQAADMLAMIQRERGITIIWVEHIMGVLMRVVDRCLVLDHGEIIASGKPAEVAHHPKVIEVYLGH